MPIITIYQGASGEGQELAETVAEALGYRCVGREVLVEASRRYGIPEAKLNEIESTFDRANRISHRTNSRTAKSD